MNNSEYYIVAFDSTHHAIKAEKVLNEMGVNIRTIPTPREITASCGLSIRFNVEELDVVKDVINNNRMAVKGVYRLIRNDKGKKAEQVI